MSRTKVVLDHPTGWLAVAADPGEVDSDQLREEIVEQSRRINQMTAERACWVAELDRRRAFELDGARSTASWLRHHARLTAGQARAVVRVARSLAHMRRAAKQFLVGELDQHRMERLATARRAHPETFARDEDLLVDHALRLSARGFAKALGYWRQAADDHAEDRAALIHARRRLHLSPTWEGAVVGDFVLDAEDGAIVMTAVSSHAGGWLKDRNDSRTPAQARADALAEICRDYLDHGNPPVSGGERPHALLIVDLETLRTAVGDHCELDGVGTITPETARRMLCDAGVSRVITRRESQVLDVGRARRTVSPAQRKALVVRDGGCAAVGCDVPHRWTDAHHREHWIDGGGTDLDNLVLVCRFHHRMIHQGRPLELRGPPPRE